MSVTMLKKLGAKQITGDVKKIVRTFCANDGDKISLYTIIGVVNGIKTGIHTTYGEWIAFMGSAEAQNHITGEKFASNMVFIPAPLDGMLQTALQDNESVEFAITVDVKRRDDLGQGYEYLPMPHISTQKNDPLAHLRSSVPNFGIPKEVEALEPPKAEEKEVPVEPAPEYNAEDQAPKSNSKKR